MAHQLLKDTLCVGLKSVYTRTAKNRSVRPNKTGLAMVVVLLQLGAPSFKTAGAQQGLGTLMQPTLPAVI